MIAVVPLAGTWIETILVDRDVPMTSVVPLAGTWIETKDGYEVRDAIASFPLRERGLKPPGIKYHRSPGSVVPLAGTWIETVCLSQWHQ